MQPTAAGLLLIDHHVHGILSGELNAPDVESGLMESTAPAPPGTTAWDSQLGFTDRRWCAPVLDLDPLVPAHEYVRRRLELGSTESARRLLTAAAVDTWLVDTGYQSDALTTPDELAALSGTPAREVVRLESIAERVIRSGVDAAGYGDAVAAGAPARLEDQVLVRHGIWAAVDTGLPLQFHAGFGDTDSRLADSDPALLHDFLLASQPSGTPVMLLHCYPYHRQAGVLANLFPHVYMDVGVALNHAGARSAAVLAEALELTPV